MASPASRVAACIIRPVSPATAATFRVIVNSHESYPEVVSAVDKLRKIIAVVIMVTLVGLGLSAITAIQRPDRDGIVLFSVTFVVFSNGIVVWLLLSLVGKRRLGRLSYTVGDVLVGPVDDVVPLPFSTKTKGTVGAMLLVSGLLTVFASGVLDAAVLSRLGTTYERVTRLLTLVYWLPLDSLWADAPVSLEFLLEANQRGAGSLAAAAAVILAELTDAIGIGDPDELLE